MPLSAVNMYMTTQLTPFESAIVESLRNVSVCDEDATKAPKRRRIAVTQTHNIGPLSQARLDKLVASKIFVPVLPPPKTPPHSSVSSSASSTTSSSSGTTAESVPRSVGKHVLIKYPCAQGTVCVVGPRSCGKTTLVKHLMCLPECPELVVLDCVPDLRGALQGLRACKCRTLYTAQHPIEVPYSPEYVCIGGNKVFAREFEKTPFGAYVIKACGGSFEGFEAHFEGLEEYEFLVVQCGQGGLSTNTTWTVKAPPRIL